MVDGLLLFITLLITLMLVPLVIAAVILLLGFEDDVHRWVLRKINKPRCQTCKFYSEFGCAHPCEKMCKRGCLWERR